MRSILTLTIMTVCLTPCAMAGEYSFDFGPADSPVAPGFTRVTETDLFSQHRSYGWVLADGKSRLYARNESFARGIRFLRLDPILTDHITGGRNFRYRKDRTFTFRVRLPAGQYLAAVILGKLTEKDATTLNRPVFWYGGYAVRANGALVAEETEDWQKHLRWFHEISETSFMPGDSLFDKYVRRYFHVHTFDFSGPDLNLAFSMSCPVNALLIVPRTDSAKLAAMTARVFAEARMTVDRQYREVILPANRLTEKQRVDYTARGAVFFVPGPRAQGAGNEACADGALLSSRTSGGLHPRARPRPDEANAPIRDLACPGETANLTFGFLPLRDLRTVSMVVTDLHGPEGAKISSTSAGLWLWHTVPRKTVKTGNFYAIEPWYSFKYKSRNFTGMLTRQITLTIRIPATAKPGRYSARVIASSQDLPKPVQQQVVLQVLPFQLRKPDMLFGMYNYSVFSTLMRYVFIGQCNRKPDPRSTANALTRRLLLRQRKTGFTTATGSPLALSVRVDKDNKLHIEKSRWRVWTDFMETYIEVFGRTPVPAYGIGWGGVICDRTAPGFWNTRQGLAKWRQHGYTPQAISNMEKLVTFFHDEARRRNWPEIIFYIQDEMANNGVASGRMGEERARIFRKLADRLGFRICASMNGPVELPELKYLHIAIPNGALPITRENLAMMRAHKTEPWFYNIGNNRFMFGYWLLKVRPGGRLQWGYNCASAYCDQVPMLPSLGGLDYTPVLNSNLEPARRWDMEQMGEGVMDYRYAITLEALVRQRGAPNRPEAGQAAQRAGKLLKMITDGLHLDVREYAWCGGPWSARTCARLRGRLKDAIIKLKEKR